MIHLIPTNVTKFVIEKSSTTLTLLTASPSMHYSQEKERTIGTGKEKEFAIDCRFLEAKEEIASRYKLVFLYSKYFVF